jgi:penicillin-binding protein 2
VRLNSAIGQGNVKVTVLQIAVMYAAIANGGEVLTPYLVDRIRTEDGRSCFRPRPSGAPTSTGSSAPIATASTQGLIGVVNDELGTAYSERPDNIVVAGKTGTAQVGASDRVVADADAPLAGFNTTQDHSWFAAYAPADAPQIVVVAFVEHGGAGADAAAPIVMTVLESYLGTQQPARRTAAAAHAACPRRCPASARARSPARGQHRAEPRPRGRADRRSPARRAPSGRRPGRRQGSEPVPRARRPQPAKPGKPAAKPAKEHAP